MCVATWPVGRLNPSHVARWVRGVGGGGAYMTAESASVQHMRTITLRLSVEAYETVRRYAEHDQQSMNSWLETLLDAEDMRRRCEAHGRWMAENPDLVGFAEASADRNLATLQELLPQLGEG